ncbi:MAG TPA: hypothetical protein VGY97_08425 [Solirubrobacteraceae bacterium]|jgi:hypothetical protein|nr:hypothetical protein [Solirubrobacteraceae bacterium]
MTGREANIVAALTEAAVAPVDPLPPVGRTDAVSAFGRYLGASPVPNRWGLRLVLLGLDQGPRALRFGAPLRRLGAADRDAYLARLAGSRLAPVVEAVRGLVQLCYYGDDAVMRLLGYDPAGRVARGRALRDREGRW